MISITSQVKCVWKNNHGYGSNMRNEFLACFPTPSTGILCPNLTGSLRSSIQIIIGNLIRWKENECQISTEL